MLDAAPASVPDAPAGAIACGGRDGCTVTARQPAGRGAHGETLEVLTLAVPPNADEQGCTPSEVWLDARTAPPTSHLLIRICNDGYGAAGIGEDEIQVRPNQLVHTRSGGSAWRWTETTTLTLSPLHVSRKDIAGYWAIGTNDSTEQWSRDAFTGEVSWWSPPCNADGDAPDAQDASHDGPRYAYHPIPAVTLPRELVTGGWKTVSLGRCAALADASHGYVLSGHPSADDASLRVVAASDRQLFVEVHDDHFTGPTARPQLDDHLELWLADQPASYMDHCIDTQKKLVSVAIRVADGAVTSTSRAATRALRVERVVAGTTARFAIGLPPGYAAVTVVYSDGDDGRMVDSRLATSKLVRGSWPTLGALRPIAAADATCELRGGRLEPVLGSTFTPL